VVPVVSSLRGRLEDPARSFGNAERCEAVRRRVPVRRTRRLPVRPADRPADLSESPSRGKCADDPPDEVVRDRLRQVELQRAPAGEFYYAERYHQQYLDRNPNGYCPIHATGVKCGPSA